MKIIKLSDAGTGCISAWSPSRLKVFETCRWRSYLSQVLKLEEEKHPAAQRGIDVHDDCEHFVDGTLEEFPESLTKSPKFMKFMPDFENLRHLYAEAKVDLEGDWAFDKEWAIVDWRAKNAWGRMKLDAFVWGDDDRTTGTVIDHKTGRKFGNEVAHADQAMIYTVGSFMRYPTLQMIDIEFWYLDQGEKSFPQRFTRQQALTFLPRISDRAIIMTTAKEADFKPKPSFYNCRYCPFNREENGCEWRFIG